jgi:RNA polymerase sigma-70 factor (ECF subfamily)
MDSQPVRIEELLAHAGWVRRLAARLVRDAGTAEDVAQEVWAYALSSPPRDRSNLRAWLSAAVRNTARSLQRSQARRADREAAAAPQGYAPAAAELVERAHLHRDLVEQVLALDEPHRSIVLAHWFEELSLAEVARRLGLTERVARARLDQAHALLRQRLDKSSGGRAVWSLAFVKWTQPQLAAAGAGTALTLGGLIVGSKLVVGTVAVVLVAGLGWLLWPGAKPSASLASNLSTPQAPVSGVEGTPPEISQGTPDSARESVALPDPNKAPPSAATGQRWIVRGHVHGAPAGREAETKLTAQFIGKFNIQDKVVGRPSSDGAFEFEVTEAMTAWLRSGDPNELQLVAEHPVCLIETLRVPFASPARDTATSTIGPVIYDCELTLRSAAVATGRVVVPANWTPVIGFGREPTRPGVGLFDFSNGGPQAQEVLEQVACDAEGRWTLRGNRGGEFTVIAIDKGLRPTAKVVTLALGQSTDVGAIELDLGASIQGRVLRSGRPVAGAHVVASAQFQTRNRIVLSSPGSEDNCLTPTGTNDFEFESAKAITRADGSYRISGLAAADYQLQVLNLDDAMFVGARTHFERTVRAPQSGVDLEGVPPTIELALTVNGRAPTDTEVEDLEIALVEMAKLPREFPIDLARMVRGERKIQLEARVSYELRVPAGRYAPAALAIEPLELGEERTIAVDLKPQDQESTLVVRFVADPPEALTLAQFALIDASAPRNDELNYMPVERSKQGTFVLPHRAPGRYRVLVRPFDYWKPADSSYYLATEFEVLLPAKETVEHSLQLDVGGRFRLSAKDEHGDFMLAATKLRDSSGKTLPTDFYFVDSGGLSMIGWGVQGTHANDHPPLPAGHYEITLQAQGFTDELVPFDLVAGRTMTLEVHMKRP